MKTCIHRPLLLTALAACGLALGACQTDKHTMVEARPGMTVVCKDCYAQAVKMQHASGSRWGRPLEQTHQVHQCPSCKTEMSTYVENGVAMIKCAGCAPEGIACDKCLPPKGYTGPMLSESTYGK